MRRIEIHRVARFMLLGIFLTVMAGILSCKRSETGPSPSPCYGIQGVKEIVVSPKDKGVNVVALFVNEGCYGTLNAEIRKYDISNSGIRLVGRYPLPTTLLTGTSDLADPHIYPVEGTGSSFLLSLPPYFINLHDHFYRVKDIGYIGGISYNVAFKVKGGYYFSRADFLYTDLSCRYIFPNCCYADNLEEKRLSEGLQGACEKPPFKNAILPQIVCQDNCSLSSYYAEEGGEVFGDGKYFHIYAINEEDSLNGYLFIGKILINDYSMTVTDVRYIRYPEDGTLTTIEGIEYFDKLGFVIFTRNYPIRATSEEQKGIKVIDRVEIRNIKNLRLTGKAELSYTVSPHKLPPFFPLAIFTPGHRVMFDRVKHRIVSAIGDVVIVADLATLKLSKITLPSPWGVGDKGTGVWIDNEGSIWVIGMDVNSGKIPQGKLKPGLNLLKLRYGILKISEKGGIYSVKLIEVLE